MSQDDPGYHVDEIDDWIESVQEGKQDDSVPAAIRELTVALYRIGGMLAERLDDIDATLQEQLEDDDD